MADRGRGRGARGQHPARGGGGRGNAGGGNRGSGGNRVGRGRGQGQRGNHDNGQSGPSQGRGQPQPPSAPTNATQAPNGVCRMFWTAGSCSRAFECTFKHLKGSNASAGADSNTSTSGTHAPAAPATAPDFFSVEGLAVTAGAGRVERHSLSPVEAHNNVRPFLRDNYHFENAGRVQGFVRILASVNDRNKTWTSDDAQAFLDLIVQGNGILRIGDVLRFKPVSHTIGQHTGNLSFQRGYFPIFEFMSSDLILKTTLHKNTNHLYTLLEHNYDEIQEAIRACVGGMVAAKTWRDTTPNLPPMLQSDLDGVLVFKSLTTVYLQFLNRFKNTIKQHPDLVEFVNVFAGWFETWATDVSSDLPHFQDTICNADSATRRLIINQLRDEVARLVSIIERESNTKKKTAQAPSTGMTPEQRRQARIVQLKYTYDPPGELRPEGPRHDNDFADISEIRVAPTHDELLSPNAPYLPVFSPEAPHHLPVGSMERHLDIQFRLLREELISPIRNSVVAIDNDVTTMLQAQDRVNRRRAEMTKLEQLLGKGGGAYKTSGFDSVFFRLYANAEFCPVKAERRDLTVGLMLDTPPSGAARDKDPKKREAYWEHSRLLQGGSLVVLCVVQNGGLRAYLGTISSGGRDIAESAKGDADRIQVRIAFFDPEVELLALRGQRQAHERTMFLIDNDVMYEAARPFLERLQTIEPTEIPFMRYIAHGGTLADVQVLPPKFATAPRFKYNLSCMAKPGTVIKDLDITQENDVARAWTELLANSTLDPSQVDAVINTLLRELSLIQGPPGTGKSFTGRELLRILIASGVRPIILIAYTNHALDHMLTDVLDAGITQKLVRLGSRSGSERISEYSLHNLERMAGRTTLNRSIGRQFAVMKELEEQMSKVMAAIQEPTLTSEDIERHLSIHYPEHAERLALPPFWIQELAQRHWQDVTEQGEWVTTGKDGKAQKKDEKDQSLYRFWRECLDIQYIIPQTLTQDQPPQVSPMVQALFSELGFGDELPPMPMTQRPLSTLLDASAMWSMSDIERVELATMWEDEIRSLAYNTNLEEYEKLRLTYREACQEYEDIRDEVRRRLLSEVDIIGCTTTGAAKLVSLLTSIAPRVLMVEEAGQVLEAHILTSLVASVHHLICIGDPEQLRPTLATFSLSMDSERGKELFKFDRSLMERLATEQLPMTQINVQRRMRPEISHHIRTILYPQLQDHDIVSRYPHVHGMQSDVFFLNHTNAEGGAEDSASKFNMYEVQMVRDLVLYFLRQGEYSQPGDIAVLCAYLGQLQKVRQALRDMKVAVALDERDEQQLAHAGLEEEVTFEQVIVAKHIVSGTVDIFQGREAKVVIVSLVRNTGTFETESAPIGFLKSTNRINVALSRAKHGLYVLGNASNLRKNKTWTTVLDEMETRAQIGPGFPIVCPRHPDQVQEVSKPGDLGRFAPAGGCLLPCGSQLPCGHICPSVCHDARDNHRSTQCNEPCPKTPCPRSHPCQNRCFEDCGDCKFPIYNVQLPCGHEKAQIACHLLERLDDAKCNVLVTKKLPRCEHSASMPCHKDPAKHKCQELCGGVLDCCGKTCKSRCSACLDKTVHSTNVASTVGKVRRSVHVTHPCERPLYCHHPCGLDCEKDHRCNRSCLKPCRQQCSHQKCAKPCSTPCTPCMEPCTWSCPHHSCPVTCGSICSRLPCDEPCANTLKCGHPCPSVCGEPCNVQLCTTCMPAHRKADVVDFIMQRTLGEIDVTSTDPAERLIALACKHVFTVETLDGHCRMNEFYEVDVMGQYISTKEPPTEYQLPPTCPTCRGPITSPRYGRVTKRATLDILEQNVASTMSKSLEALNPALEKISEALGKWKEAAGKLAYDMENISDPAERRDAWLNGGSTEALPETFLHRGAMHSLHGFSTTEAKAWNDVVKDLVQVYRKAHTMSATRGAHLKAYEGALTTLYRLELDAIASDPERATDTPEPIALKAVMSKIGQPPPKADVRFQIDAMHTLCELRFMLGEVAAARVDGLPATATEEAGVRHRKLWTSFVGFVYQSCKADAQKACEMALRSAASRQAAKCGLYILRAEFEDFRFRMMEDERALSRGGNRPSAEDRKRLGDQVEDKREEMQRKLQEYREQYIRSRPVNDTSAMQKEREWFQGNCGAKVDRFMGQLEELEGVVRNGGRYEPLSMQEREMIVKAFDFGYTGHFYNCPNGHPYTIGECGGAMVTSQCPECGETIGGGNHTLLGSNTTASEFETILRGTGVPRGFY